MAYIGNQPVTGDNNNFKVLDDIKSYTLTFDGSSTSVVSVSDDTITSTGHRFIQGQRVTYTDGSGSAIAGLTDGTVYYIIWNDANTFKLASSSSNAAAGTAINITGVGTGTEHTINVAFDGTNTKFKASYNNGTEANISRVVQLQISLSDVIQEPQNTSSPTSGFGFDSDSVIVFASAPASSATFWGVLFANNFPTWELSDNDINNFTGNGSTTAYTLSKDPGKVENIIVTLDGVIQYPSDNSNTRAYNISGNVLTFTSAPGDGVLIQVRHIGYAAPDEDSGGVTGFYGRTGSVFLTNSDNIVVNDAEIAGNLTVQGTMTTLDTKVTEVDQLEVAANNTTVGVAITQSGSGNILQLYDGATEVFTVEDGGLVGIQTNNLDNPLHVFHPTKNNIALFESGDSFGSIGISDSNGSVSLVTTLGKLQIRTGGDAGTVGTNGDVTMVIESGGDVGIGTDNPTEKLDVLGNLVVAEIKAVNRPRIVLSAPDDGTNYRHLFGANLKVDSSGTFTTPTANISGGGWEYLPANSINQHGNIRYLSAPDTNATTSTPVERFRIDNDGNVGIGTDNPTQELTIHGSTFTSLLIKSDRTSSTDQIGGVSFMNQAVGVSTATMNALVDGTMLFKTAGYERLRIKSTGQVGINDTNPSHQLSVIGNTSFYGVCKVGANNDISPSSGGAGQLIIDADGYTPYIAADATAMYIGHNSSSRDLVLQTDETNRITIDGSTGNVGIGTDNPSAEISIWSTSPNIKLQDTDPYVANQYGNISQSAGILQLTARGDGATHGGIYLYAQNNSETLNVYRVTDNYHLWYTANASNSEKMRLTNAGNLGIGTINPAHNLHVYEDSGDSVITIESTGDGNDAAINFRRTSSAGNHKGAGSIYVTGDTSASEAVMNFGVGHNISAGQVPRLSIKGDGEVGIGTNNPISKLHVAATNTTVWPFTSPVSGTYSYTPYPHELIIDNDVRGTEGSYAGIYFNAGADTDGSKVSTARIAAIDTGSYKADLVFSNRGYGGSDHRENLRITSDGKVGINETNPVAKLHIDGSGEEPCLVLPDTTNSRYSVGFGNINVGGVGQRLDFYAGDSGDNADNLTNAARHMSLTSQGRLGIGTITPDATLDVSGNRQGTAIDIDGAFKQDGSMNWNFAQQQWVRSASNTNVTKILSILSADDSASDTNLYNNINFLARTSSNFGAASTSRGIGVSLEITSPNEIKFGTNTAERFSIESDGDIRIGSDSQYGWIRGWQSSTAYGGGSMFFSADHNAQGTDQGASGRSNMIFRCRGSEKMRITGIGGSVGIGTEYPDTLLHLYGSTGTEKLLTLNGGSLKRNNYIGINGSDNLIIAADHDQEGGSSSVRIHVDGSEIIRVLKSQVDIGYGSAVNIAKFCQSDNNHQIVGQASNNVAALDVYSQHGDDVNRISFAVSDNRTGSKSNSFVVNGRGKVGINTDAMSAHPGNSMTQGDMLHIVSKTGNTAMINLNGSLIGGGITPTSIAHDTYFEIDTPFYGGCAVLTAYSTFETYPQPVASGLFYFDTGLSLHLHKLEGGHPSLVVSTDTSTTAGDHTDNKIVVTPVGTSTKKLRVWWRVTNPAAGYIRWTFL